jgi:hypothetical protein
LRVHHEEILKTPAEGREILKKIMENTSFVCTRYPPQENPEVHHEEILVAESQPIDAQSLDSTPESSPEPKIPKEEDPLPLELSHSFKEDLFEDFRNTSNYSC